MAIRNAEAQWKGTLKDGSGTIKLGSGAFEGTYSFASRFETGNGTNPEELIAAAHAGCYTMALDAGLTKAGHKPVRIQTKAEVVLEKVNDVPTIVRIELSTEAEVPELDEKEFLEAAESAKKNCPVSRALTGPQITLNARLLGAAKT